MNVRRTLVWSSALLWVATPLLSAAPPPPKLALTGARIIPVVGETIAKGTLLIENGKITAVGENVKIPFDAMEVDVTGKVLFPGLIDAHSARGLDIRNENLPVTPFLDVYDAIDPSRLYFEDALRDGITSIHVIVANNCVIGGLSRVVAPIGLTPDEMTLATPVALKLSVAPKRGSDRMVQMALLRETFLELADYLENLAEEKYEESLEKKDEKIDVGPEEAAKRGKELIKSEDYDDKHRNLIKLTRGELDAFIYCGRAGDVARAVTIAKDNGFFDRSTLVLGPDCYKAVEEVKAAGRPVVLDPRLLYRERDPVTGKIRETFVPKVFADARVKFALLPYPDGSLAERYLNYQAARCVKHGVRRRTALKAITLYPAKLLGIADRVGSLEVGKLANVLVLSGDPLDFNTWVDAVYINGIQAYDRDKDIRLKQLFGEEPAEVAEESEPDENGV
ncbi:MAG: amidohydrolase family protein, partial [Armatimonadetes bacterium]|nr:amidohydrolase family protein [Armatimonadota bacterium]